MGGDNRTPLAGKDDNEYEVISGSPHFVKTLLKSELKIWNEKPRQPTMLQAPKRSKRLEKIKKILRESDWRVRL